MEGVIRTYLKGELKPATLLWSRESRRQGQEKKKEEKGGIKGRADDMRVTIWGYRGRKVAFNLVSAHSESSFVTLLGTEAWWCRGKCWNRSQKMKKKKLLFFILIHLLSYRKLLCSVTLICCHREASLEQKGVKCPSKLIEEVQGESVSHMPFSAGISQQVCDTN